MRPEYDLRGGVRGKYYERYHSLTFVQIIHDSPWVQRLSTASGGSHSNESTRLVGFRFAEVSPQVSPREEPSSVQ
jgi:hypothetical protein